MIEAPVSLLLSQLAYLPLHFIWLVAFFAGLGLAASRSGAAGGLLIAAAILHGLGTLGTLAQQYMLVYMTPDNIGTIAMATSLLLTGLAVVQYSLLIAAVWAGRPRA